MVNVVAVQSDPKFTGEANCPISAEDWLLQLRASAAAQGKTGAEAIKYYRLHLQGIARLRFGDKPEDIPRSKWALASEDEEYWCSCFKQAFFPGTTQVESVSDWVRIKQGVHESAANVMTRITSAVNIFWEAIVGAEPRGPRLAADAAATAAKIALEDPPKGVCQPSDEAKEEMNKVIVEAEVELRRSIEAVRSIDSVRVAFARVAAKIRDNRAAHAADPHNVPLYTDAEQLNMLSRIDADTDRDAKTLDEACASMKRMFKETILVAGYVAAHNDLQERVRRALALKTLQTAFSNNECKKEAYNFLKNPERDLTELKPLVKQIEAVAAANKLGASNRPKVCAVTEPGDDDSNDALEDDPELIAAVNAAAAATKSEWLKKKIAAKKGNNGGNKPSTSGGNGGSPASPNPHKGKVCGFCGRKNHIAANCHLKKKCDAQKAKNTSAVAEASEN